MNQNDNDLSLIERFKNGDQAAFEELVLRYQDRVYNICRYMLGRESDAEDAGQDVFIKIYKKLGHFKPSPYLGSWVYRIAVNTCIDYKRKPFHEPLNGISRDGMEYPIEEVSNSPGPERSLESKQTREAIIRALSRLSKKLRTVIVLKEIEGLSYEEISEALDISMGTVKSRISRAREELKELLKNLREQY